MRAGVSESIFPDVFSTVDECFQAAFEEGLGQLARAVDTAAGLEVSWLDRLRAGLVAFLGFLDDEPVWGRLLILESPITDGPAGLRREHRVLGVLSSLLDHGALQASGKLMPASMLTSEFVVGGAISVIRAQMLKADGPALVELAPSLMSFIVRPYLGHVAANAEFEGRPSANDDAAGGGRVPPREAELAPAAVLPVRMTHRTTLVLRAIADAPYSNNRGIAQSAGLTDEGQTSKLLSRLERQGVIENVGVGPARGEPNAWLITAAGTRTLALIGQGAASGRPRRRSARGGDAA
jgi:AcrR family transcriptional regulator